MQTASEYAKATKLLFDAYVYMGNAEKETDPGKKAKLCAVAEKVLQMSAGSFAKAEHAAKREQVLRLLEKVKEERELALSLDEVLSAPTIVSTTTAFSTPSPTYESAVGLERFEHADIEAYLTAPEEATVGEELDVRIDLANVGKNPALLVRVNELIPRCLKATVLPSQLSIENNSIDLKGKKLEPLKIESIKLSMQAVEPGTTSLSPKVVFVDDVGRFKTCKPEQVRNCSSEIHI